MNPPFFSALIYKELIILTESYPCVLIASFNSDNCSSESDCDYQQINGGEGNGEVQGYFYPDSEDLDNDYMPDFKDDYFTYSFRPKINTSLLIEDAIYSVIL